MVESFEVRDVLDRMEADGASRSDLALMLANAWLQSPILEYDDGEVLALFDRVGYFVVTRSGRVVLGCPAPSRLAVFRGVYGPAPRSPVAMSWSTDRRVARGFALSEVRHGDEVQRFAFRAIYRATATRVLAQFRHRGEWEAVVDPAGLRDVRLVERFPADEGSVEVEVEVPQVAE